MDVLPEEQRAIIETILFLVVVVWQKTSNTFFDELYIRAANIEYIYSSYL